MAAVAAIGGTDIRKVMKSQGPIISTVVLRCKPSSSENKKINPEYAAIKMTDAPCEEKGTEKKKPVALTEAHGILTRVILSDLIDEVKIDTTPSKSKVAELLGGPFTFLGQYEDEGIVLMVRSFPDDLEDDLRNIYYNNDEDEDEDDRDEATATSPNKAEFSFAEQLSKHFNIKALKAVCLQRDINTDSMKEKHELIQVLIDYQKRLPPYNKHQLQPPLHNTRVRGDIVIMKVGETEEELDDNNVSVENDKNVNDKDKSKKGVGKKGNDDTTTTTEPNIEEKSDHIESDVTKSNFVTTVPSNDEFFLDYSKDAYIKFASRTDIPEHDVKTEDCDNDYDVDQDEASQEGGKEITAMRGFDDDDDDDDDDDGCGCGRTGFGGVRILLGMSKG